jgi:hypothetical protein
MEYAKRFITNCPLPINCIGYPEGSPNTHAYFSYPLHKSQEYSVSFSFQPKKAISGDSLVFGNDFDNPIRDRLPPGFSTALRIVRWMIDPGLYGNAYTDKPYLYGPALSSLNCLRICGKPGAFETINHWKSGNRNLTVNLLKPTN